MNAIKPDADGARELIAFRIGAQEFCVDIMTVCEIRGWTAATPLPRAPGFMRGVINLRGTVLPIVDFAIRLGLPVTEPTPRHVVIVAQVKHQQVGLLVDAVSDILNIDTAEIQPTPDIASDLVKQFVHGLLPVDGRMIGLIVMDDIFRDESLVPEHAGTA